MKSTPPGSRREPPSPKLRGLKTDSPPLRFVEGAGGSSVSLMTTPLLAIDVHDLTVAYRENPALWDILVSPTRERGFGEAAACREFFKCGKRFLREYSTRTLARASG